MDVEVDVDVSSLTSLCGMDAVAGLGTVVLGVPQYWLFTLQTVSADSNSQS